MKENNNDGQVRTAKKDLGVINGIGGNGMLQHWVNPLVEVLRLVIQWQTTIQLLRQVTIIKKKVQPIKLIQSNY